MCREIQTPSQQWLKTVFSTAENSNNNIIAPRGVHYQITCIKSADRHYNVDRIKGKATKFVSPGLDYQWQLSEETQCQHPWASNEHERIKINTISLEMHNVTRPKKSAISTKYLME